VAPSAAPSRAALALALASVYLVWGSTYLFIRLALEGYPPFLLGGTRFLSSGIALLAWQKLRGAPMPTAVQWRNCAVVGTLLLAVGNGLVCFAEQSVASAIAAIVIASVPAWAGVFSWSRGEPIGMAALVIAAIAWAFGSIWGRGRDLPTPFTATAAQMISGGAVMMIVALLLGERYELRVRESADRRAARRVRGRRKVAAVQPRCDGSDSRGRRVHLDATENSLGAARSLLHFAPPDATRPPDWNMRDCRLGPVLVPHP
jgi:drug/metabolite transporter (DMT)-like permease